MQRWNELMCRTTGFRITSAPILENIGSNPHVDPNIDTFLFLTSRTATRKRHALFVAGPATWNGLPVTLHQITVDHSNSFLSALKTVMFDEAGLGVLLSRQS